MFDSLWVKFTSLQMHLYRVITYEDPSGNELKLDQFGYQYLDKTWETSSKLMQLVTCCITVNRLQHHFGSLRQVENCISFKAVSWRAAEVEDLERKMSWREANVPPLEIHHTKCTKGFLSLAGPQLSLSLTLCSPAWTSWTLTCLRAGVVWAVITLTILDFSLHHIWWFLSLWQLRAFFSCLKEHSALPQEEKEILKRKMWLLTHRNTAGIHSNGCTLSATFEMTSYLIFTNEFSHHHFPLLLRVIQPVLEEI